MNRRDFLRQLTTAAVLAQSRFALAAPLDAKITNIRLSTLEGKFAKFVAMNAYDKEPKGKTYQHTLIRVQTNAGVEGIAPGGYSNLCTTEYATQLKPLIGARISELYTLANGQVIDRGQRFSALLAKNRHLDCAFYDIIGQLLGKPIWSLIADKGKQQIPLYDGTLYFADVWFHDRGIAAVTDECLEAVHSGYRGMKLKIGRGDKWMPRELGEQRDIAVVQAVRGAIGPDILLMADANYGYRGRYPQAVQLMRQIQPASMLWMEEIFPETPDLYTQFRNDLAAQHDPCGLAFGEHMFATQTVDPYLAPRRLIDFVQYDIRANGFLDSVAIARKCAQVGATVAPHNWASQMGHIMDLHLARALDNHGPSETDRSACEVLRTEPTPLKMGCVPAPTRPGLGVTIDESVYRSKHAASEIVIS